MPRAEKMEAVDTTWLRLDQPTNRMVIVGIMLLRGPIDLDRLEALLAERLLRHPRFRQRLRDDSTRLAARARADGVDVALNIWPVVPHVWQIACRFLPEGRQSLQQAAAFLHQHADASEPTRAVTA